MALKEFVLRAKEHIIDIIMRDNPTKKAYYNLVFADQTLDELVNYKLSAVYDDVPETGFLDDHDRPNDIIVGEYFRLLFGTLEDKLQQAVPREDKKDLSITQLIWRGKPIKKRKKDFNVQTPKFMIDYLITDIKGKKASHYGKGYKPAPMMKNK